MLSLSFFRLSRRLFELLSLIVRASLFAGCWRYFKNCVFTLFIFEARFSSSSCCSLFLGLAFFVIFSFVTHVSIVVVVSKPIVSINLLELWAESFFCLGWWEHNLQLLYCFSNFLFITCIISKSNTEQFAHFSQNRYGEMAVLVQTSSWSEEGSFQSEWVDKLELLPHDNSTSRLFLFLNGEITEVKVKEIWVLMIKKWENSFFKSVGSLIGASIHEQIFAPWMTMDITVKQNVSAFKCFTHHHFGGTVFWTLLHAWSNPLSV